MTATRSTLAALTAACTLLTLTACTSGTLHTSHPTAPTSAVAVATKSYSPPPAPPTTSAPPIKWTLPVGLPMVVLADDGTVAGQITAVSVRSTRNPADQYSPAPAHGYFVIFTIRADAKQAGLNVGETDFYALINGQHYNVGDGNAYSATDPAADLNYATLNAGEHTQGVIAFDLPAVHGTLEYAPNFNGGDLGGWKF
jgi:hypothetical protein